MTERWYRNLRWQRVLGPSFLCALALTDISLLQAEQVLQPSDDQAVVERQAAGGTNVTSARLEPLVIRAELDTFRLILGHALADVTSMAITLPEGRFTWNGRAATTITLEDAGNQTFAVDGLGLVHTEMMLGSEPLREVDLLLEFGSASVTVRQELGLALRYIDPSVPIPQVNELAADARATSHVVSIARPLQGTFPQQFILREVITNRYYDFFVDDRDFLIMVAAYPNRFARADSIPVRNDTEGIGSPLFDDSTIFGSDGVLQQVITLRQGSIHNAGLLDHEIAHRWQAYLGMGLSDSRGHWGIMDRPGVLSIERLSENTYRVIRSFPRDQRAMDIELYLEGLVELSQVVSPIRNLVNPTFLRQEPCPPEMGSCFITDYLADEMAEVSTESILSAHGLRIPAASAPKHYRSGVAVAYDRVLSPTELAYFHLAAQEIEKPSSEVLGELLYRERRRDLATLSTSLSCVDPDGDSVCGVVDNCPTIANFDQDPEVCDQRIMDIVVELSSHGTGTMRWRTSHEVDLQGFDVVTVNSRGQREKLTPSPIPCISCNTGDGHEYSFALPRHRGGRNVFIEGICDDDCVGPHGPAAKIHPGNSNPRP